MHVVIALKFSILEPCLLMSFLNYESVGEKLTNINRAEDK